MGIWQFVVPRVNPTHFSEFEKVYRLKFAEICRLEIPKCTLQRQSFEIDRAATLDLTNVSCVPVRWRLLREVRGVAFEPCEGTLMPSHSETIKMTVIEPLNGITIALLNIQGGSALGFEFWSKKSK
jgi:hypothetical protein